MMTNDDGDEDDDDDTERKTNCLSNMNFIN